jgi:hypothetical protein
VLLIFGALNGQATLGGGLGCIEITGYVGLGRAPGRGSRHAWVGASTSGPASWASPAVWEQAGERAWLVGLIALGLGRHLHRGARRRVGVRLRSGAVGCGGRLGSTRPTSRAGRASGWTRHRRVRRPRRRAGALLVRAGADGRAPVGVGVGAGLDDISGRGAGLWRGLLGGVARDLRRLPRQHHRLYGCGAAGWVRAQTPE